MLNQLQAEIHVWLFLMGRFSPLILLCFLLMSVPADNGEPKKFHPLDSFAPEDLYPLDTFVPEDSMATQPKQFYPLDTFDSEDFVTIQKDPIALALAIVISSPISGMSEESKLAKFDCITSSLACSHPMPVLTLACTINGKTPCPSAPSSVIKSYYSGADVRSKGLCYQQSWGQVRKPPTRQCP